MKDSLPITSTFVLSMVTAIATPVQALELIDQSGESGEFAIAVGAEYTTGDYGGATNTNIWNFPLTLRYDIRRSQWSLTVPYLIVDGPGDVVILGNRDQADAGRPPPRALVTLSPTLAISLQPPAIAF